MGTTLNWNVLKKAIPAFVLTTALSAGFVLVSRNPETLGTAGNTKNDKNRFIQVQLLGVNDFHGQLDVTRKVHGRYAGRADYLAAYLEQRKAKNKNTLLVHSGDMVGGSPPISSFQQDEPTIDVLNKMGFDIGTLGNHEFDRGVQEMMRLIHGGTGPAEGYFKGAQFPYICANVIDVKTGKLILPPYIIKKVDGVPIGFIGVVLSGTPDIEGPINTAGVKFTNEVDAINRAAAELKKQGVRAIVVLAHNGGGQAANGTASGDVIDMAKKMDPEVDVVFAGHSHTYLNTVVDGKLVVEARSYGIAFSDVNLEIDPATRDIVSKKADIVTVYQDAIKPDKEITAMMNKYEAKVAPTVNKFVGTAAMDISKGSTHSGESALGNLIADSQRSIMKTDFAFMNAPGIRSDILGGKITLGQLFTVLPFKETLVKMTLTGDEIRRLLNQQWQPQGTNILQISGLKYSWNGTKGDGSKVVDIFLADGTPIDPKANYSVAVNSYLADGGDGFPVFLEGKNRVNGPLDITALENYLQQLKQPFTYLNDGRIEKIH